MYNDIFSKGIESYWKNEGCNSRMQKYCKISKILDKINYILKYLMMFILISISIITIFKLSSGAYYEDITNGKSGLILILDVIPTLMGIIIAGLVAYIISIRFNILENNNMEKYMFKFIIAIPLYYLVLIYITKMDKLLLVFAIIMLYLLIVNVNHLLSHRVKYLYNIAIGGDNSKNKLSDVNVVFEAVVKNDNKKEKENKRNARKR